MTVSQEVLRIVRAITHDTKMADKKLLLAAYLEEGLLDSFQLIEMISDLEARFKIQFLPGELTAEKFRTLKGVAETIEKKTKKKK